MRTGGPDKLHGAAGDFAGIACGAGLPGLAMTGRHAGAQKRKRAALSDRPLPHHPVSLLTAHAPAARRESPLEPPGRQSRRHDAERRQSRCACGIHLNQAASTHRIRAAWLPTPPSRRREATLPFAFGARAGLAAPGIATAGHHSIDYQTFFSQLRRASLNAATA